MAMAASLEHSLLLIDDLLKRALGWHEWRLVRLAEGITKEPEPCTTRHSSLRLEQPSGTKRPTLRKAPQLSAATPVAPTSADLSRSPLPAPPPSHCSTMRGPGLRAVQETVDMASHALAAAPSS